MDDDDTPFDLLGSPGDLGPHSSRHPSGAKPSRFQPKMKGKIKAEPGADQAPLPPPPHPVRVIKKENLSTVPKDGERSQGPSGGGILPAEDPESSPMEVDDDDGEDRVVREIDVLFTPSPLDEDTLLYVMQYPLRPSWRPFELNERCEEVRVKPNQAKIEIALSVNGHSGNYNQEVAGLLRMQKETLSSSKIPFLTDYAVGLLVGSQLHLNPVHAVVQLRPSRKNVGSLQKKHNVRGIEVSTKPEEESIGESSKSSIRQRKLLVENSNENIDDAEPWVSLEYHATDSVLASRYQQKMVSGEKCHIQFMMNPSDYVNSLCPGISTDNKIVKGPSRRVLLSMSLEERLKTWLSEVSQVNRFVALMHLAPTDSEEHVLKVLWQYADLVQGLWVSKSSLLYEGRDAQVRDFILLLFSKNRMIHKDKLKAIRNTDGILERILSPLAVQRPSFKDWKFKEATDSSFEAQYPDIVEEQLYSWSQREKDIMDSLCGAGKLAKNARNSNSAKGATASGKVDPGVNRGKDGTVSSTTTMTNESREALPKALMELFHLHKVCSLDSIAQGLREMALKKSRLWKGQASILVHAANGVSAPSPELKSVLSQLAVDIHGVYVLKSVGNPVLDPLRNIVINLFLKRAPNAKLEKKEIERAALISLKRDISDSEYNQVLNELCVNWKGAWLLKSVD